MLGFFGPVLDCRLILSCLPLMKTLVSYSVCLGGRPSFKGRCRDVAHFLVGIFKKYYNDKENK